MHKSKKDSEEPPQRKKMVLSIYKRQAGNSKTKLAKSPRSSRFSLEQGSLGGHMAKRMGISCLLFTVPTTLEGKVPQASHSAG